MTLAFERAVSGAKTHALVIGCGRFPHFDPTLELNREATIAGARQMMEFLASHRDKFVAPLASIECLLSDPAVSAGQDMLGADLTDAAGAPPATLLGVGDKVENVTLDNIEKACDAWIGRCEPGDHMVFYMSSHGVAGHDSALGLCEDVNAQPHKRWSQSINVTKLADGLPTTNAGRAFVFFDACQEVVPEILGQAPGGTGYNPILYSLQQLPQARRYRTFALAASRLGAQAWAPDGPVPPYFTQALLDGLRASSVEALPNLGWTVTGRQLQYSLPMIAEAALGWRELETEPLTKFAELDFALLTVDQPSVPVLIRTEVDSHLPQTTHAEVICDDAAVAPIPRPNGPELAWRFRIEAHRRREYTTSLAFANGTPAYLPVKFDALPPAKVIVLTQ